MRPLRLWILALVALLPIFFIQPACSAKKEFPRGCEKIGFVYKEKALILIPEENKQTVYLIKNDASHSTVLHYFDPEHPSLGSWDTIIRPRTWGSFASDMPMLFTCRQYSKQKENMPLLDCVEILRVCQYPRAKVPLHMHGSYFISKDNYSMNSAVRKTIREGVLLRW